MQLVCGPQVLKRTNLLVEPDLPAISKRDTIHRLIGSADRIPEERSMHSSRYSIPFNMFRLIVDLRSPAIKGHVPQLLSSQLSDSVCT